jgi:peptidyl-prolyl cis-trans isomerase SurA
MTPSRVLVICFLVSGALGLVTCKKSPPADVAATVNNRAITYQELDKLYRTRFAQPTDQTSDDLVSINKLEVLRVLIDKEIMLQRAEKLGLMAVDADVEAEFNKLKAPYTQEEFQKQLDNWKMTVEELKANLRRDLSIQKLLNKEITSHIAITDKDIADFYSANKDRFNFAEPRVHLAQLLVTAHPDPNVRNLKNDKAQNEQQARQKIQMLEARLKQGEDFAMLAQNYSEDPDSAPNGGDLGFLPESALEKANVELRKMVMQLQPGQISPIIRTGDGYRILKVISKEPAGQRDLNDPRVQQDIRETLMARKEGLLQAAYYDAVRSQVKVVNYYAMSVLSKRGISVK